MGTLSDFHAKAFNAKFHITISIAIIKNQRRGKTAFIFPAWAAFRDRLGQVDNMVGKVHSLDDSEKPSLRASAKQSNP
ncbi:hypothetical protein B1207_01895 [Legionella quinlivanii]|uniref:Uncharacterized protein n=2 Tax=Legionella quinlivanii TaxID=45073 RepID=A0A364LNN0_9GAMM|nr:hypothetical protein B1207_01895 [Legionella quinlivanii]